MLLVSTDPASNLDEVLGVSLGNSPTPVPEVAGLLALNVDPEAAAREYRERLVGPYRGVLPEAALPAWKNSFPAPARWRSLPSMSSRGSWAIPARLPNSTTCCSTRLPPGTRCGCLSLPSAWNGFIETNTTGTSCLGPLAGLQPQHELYRATVAALSDGTLDNAGPRESARVVVADRSGPVQRRIGVIGRGEPAPGRQRYLPCVDPTTRSPAPWSGGARRPVGCARRRLPRFLAPNCRWPPTIFWAWPRCGAFFKMAAGAALGIEHADAPATTLPSPLVDLVDEIALPGEESS